MASRGRLRLLAVPLLLVLVPCAAIGVIGYQWLRLERVQEARRSQEAAAEEAVRLRADLLAHLVSVADETARAWRGRDTSAPPFAPPPSVVLPIAEAYRFTPTGGLLYPNYERAYHDLIRQHEAAMAGATWRRGLDQLERLEAQGDREGAARELADLRSIANAPGLVATLSLAEGRLALAGKNLTAAARAAQAVLECCAAARDEYGTPFSVYAASQLIAAWRRQNTLARHFPELAARLTALLEQGAIGHPADLPHILSLVEGNPGLPEATALAEAARRTAARIERQMAGGAQFERWVAASTMLGRESGRFVVSILWVAERPRLVGVLRAGDEGFLTAVFDTDQVGSWLAARAADRGRFEARIVASGGSQGTGANRSGLFPEAPGLDLVLQPRATDPALQRSRSLLFGGALAAALLLALLVGYLALRDIDRDVRVATLRANFVAGVTHELKTPLTSIRLLAETLRLKRTRDPDAADELLAAIVDESERLGRLLDNVLGFARIDRGEEVYRPEPIELRAAVASAVARLRRMTEQGGFRVTVDNAGGNLYVRADADALAQAIANLVSNAMKYSGASRQIRVAVEPAGHKAHVSVTDYGIGIPPNEQLRVFDRFYRGPEASGMAEGAGLGLALVRHFAEAHGGWVTLLSEPGKGSTFTIVLPTSRIQESGVGNRGTASVPPPES